jgi:2,3-bisphosphoglycerate-independent phosphoglycerate mutase
MLPSQPQSTHGGSVAPDHPTPVSTTAHSATPAPFCFAGHAVPAVEQQPFSEVDAASGPLVDPGHGLMELIFGS